MGYTKQLETAGIDRRVAEAHAEAARDFIMTELVTKSDLREALERQALLMTVRLGGITAGLVAAAIAVLGFLIRFH